MQAIDLLSKKSGDAIFEFRRRSGGFDQRLLMLEVCLKIVERLYMKQMLGRFSEMVAPLAPVCGDLDRPVHELSSLDHFIESPGTERIFCRPNLIFEKESAAHVFANKTREKPGCPAVR